MVAHVEITERIEADDGTASADAAGQDRRWRFPNFLTPARLTSRIVLLNIAGLIILVSGTLFLNQFRQGLIEARVESLMTQGELMAEAVFAPASSITDSIVIDPDRLIQARADSGRRPPAPDGDDPGNLEFPFSPEHAGRVLRLQSPNIRGRIYDRDGDLFVDSSSLYSRKDIPQAELPPVKEPEDKVLRRLWRKFNGWLFNSNYPLQQEYGPHDGLQWDEVKSALAGISDWEARVNDRNRIIVSVAVPIKRARSVLGALVLSTKAGEIDKRVKAERKIVLSTFMVAVLVTVLLSILLAGTIAEPIRRLSAAAEHVRRGINNRVEIPDFTGRRDEIGHLSGALRDMTTALYNRIDAIEAFAADVSHELKNPLTSLRSAVETLPFTRTDEQRDRLIGIVKDDVRRLDRLISDISDASRLDAELARGGNQPVDMRQLLRTVVMLANETRTPGTPDLEIEELPVPRIIEATHPYRVLGHDHRLGQVARNLLDNAKSFTRPGTRVRVRLRRTARDVEFRVEDEGPGIRPENLGRIFERFYTDRPAGYFGKNSGLGLAISKQIIEAHRGRIWAENRYGRAPAGSERPIIGATFIVRIPALGDDWEPNDEA